MSYIINGRAYSLDDKRACSSVFDDEHKHRYNIRRWLDEWIRQAHLGKHKILGKGLSVIDFSDNERLFLFF